jgi:5-carboxymethyl-2-hydroxymuconate isomerase
MPHFIVEYSGNLADEIDTPVLFRKLHVAAAATGVFPLGGIRSRAARRDEYRVADGHPENGFVHVVLRIGHGRDAETRKEVGEKLFTVLCDHLASVFDHRPLSISFEMQELDPVLNFKKNNIHDSVAARRQSAAE